MQMQQEMVKVDGRKLPGRKLRRVECPSYVVHQDLVGVAIVRRVRKELGWNEALRMLRLNREFGLTGNVMRALVTDCDFVKVGMFRIFRFAEVLDVDPAFEVAMATAYPDKFLETCKSLKDVDLSNFTISYLDKYKNREAAVCSRSAA